MCVLWQERWEKLKCFDFPGEKHIAIILTMTAYSRIGLENMT